MYEDDNETYAYEKGDYNILRIDWNDAKKELNLMKVEGNRTPVFKQRQFNIRLVETKEARLLLKNVS